MRILHTADWHIGQTLNGWSRDREHAAFLNALREVIVAEDADALIVAGDVFDGINPLRQHGRPRGDRRPGSDRSARGGYA